MFRRAGLFTFARPHKAATPKRWCSVSWRWFYGAQQAEAIAAQLDDPTALADAVARATSPWRHSKSVAAQRFSWERSIRPIDPQAFATPEEYREAMLDFLDLDHRWAAQDNLTNPAKEAADGVWRDLRDVLATAVDFGGLHAASHRDFLDVFMRHHTGSATAPPWKSWRRSAP